MDELEQTLNRVLSDPAELEKLSRLAGELLGGGAPPNPERRPGPVPPERGDKAALLRALSPYLTEQRRRKLQKAMRMAGALRLAGAAMEKLGGEGAV